VIPEDAPVHGGEKLKSNCLDSKNVPVTKSTRNVALSKKAQGGGNVKACYTRSGRHDVTGSNEDQDINGSKEDQDDNRSSEDHDVNGSNVDRDIKGRASRFCACLYYLFACAHF